MAARHFTLKEEAIPTILDDMPEDMDKANVGKALVFKVLRQPKGFGWSEETQRKVLRGKVGQLLLIKLESLLGEVEYCFSILPHASLSLQDSVKKFVWLPPLGKQPHENRQQDFPLLHGF